MSMGAISSSGVATGPDAYSATAPTHMYIPLHQTLMVRLTGKATIYTAQFDAQLSIGVCIVAKAGSGQHAAHVGLPWHPPLEAE